MKITVYFKLNEFHTSRTEDYPHLTLREARYTAQHIAEHGYQYKDGDLYRTIPAQQIRQVIIMEGD